MTKSKIWLLDVFMLFFLSRLLSVYRSLSAGRREMDQARAGRGKTERDRDNAGGDSSAGRYRGAGTPDRYIFCYFCILSTQLFYSLLFFLVASFSAECNNRQGGTGRDQRLRRKQCGMGEQQVRLLFCSVLFLFFSFLLPTLLPGYLLFCEVGFNNRRAGVRTDRTDAGGNRMTCIFLFSALFISSSHSSSFPLSTVQHQAGLGGA